MGKVKSGDARRHGAQEPFSIPLVGITRHSAYLLCQGGERDVERCGHISAAVVLPSSNSKINRSYAMGPQDSGAPMGSTLRGIEPACKVQWRSLCEKSAVAIGSALTAPRKGWGRWRLSRRFALHLEVKRKRPQRRQSECDSSNEGSNDATRKAMGLCPARSAAPSNSKKFAQRNGGMPKKALTATSVRMGRERVHKRVTDPPWTCLLLGGNG